MISGEGRQDGALGGTAKPLRGLAIVADDLTGACDAAVAFTPVAHPVRVHPVPESAAVANGVFAVNTSSRDLPLPEAERRLSTAFSRLPPELPVFKKIDSVFRGNTFAEIAATARSFPDSLVIVAPAFPALGRALQGGVLQVRDAAGSRSLSVQKGLRGAGCHAQLLAACTDPSALAAQLCSLAARGERLFLCDASEPSYLLSVVRAAQLLSRTVLWVGSGGLAHALASTFAPVASAPVQLPGPGATLFLIGSDHAVTQGQVVHLRSATGLAFTGCTSPVNPSVGGLLLSVSPAISPEQIRHALTHVDPREVSCLFITGGDTALRVCEALQIQALRLAQEIAPGVPLAFAEGGQFGGVPIILKSGGFGSPDLLCRIHEMFSRKELVFA